MSGIDPLTGKAPVNIKQASKYECVIKRIKGLRKIFPNMAFLSKTHLS